MDVLSSGHGTLEVPTVDGAGGLYFSDIFNGGVYHLTAAGDIAVVVPRRRGVAGLCLHADGGIVVGGRNITHVRDGVSTILLDPAVLPVHEGAPVTGFNDFVADRDGRILAGTVRVDAQLAEQQRRTGTRAGGVFGQVPGELILITGINQAEPLYEVAHPNGAAFDAPGRRLYHADTNNRRLLVSEVDAGGRPRVVEMFSTADYPGVPDGVVTDQDGGVWVALYGGGQLIRFSETGQVTDRMVVPSDDVTSMCFGGADLRTLYLTTASHREHPELGGCVLRTTTEVAGVAVSSATIA